MPAGVAKQRTDVTQMTAQGRTLRKRNVKKNYGKREGNHPLGAKVACFGSGGWLLVKYMLVSLCRSSFSCLKIAGRIRSIWLKI